MTQENPVARLQGILKLKERFFKEGKQEGALSKRGNKRGKGVMD